MRAMSRRLASAIAVGMLAALATAGCGGPEPTGASPGVSSSPVTPAPPAASAPVATASPSSAPSGALGAPPVLALEPIVAGLDAPVDVTWRAADPDALYAIERVGRIRIVRDGRLVDTPLLDIAEQVTAGGEQGLLGLAFHPDPADGRLFVYYTASDGDQVVSSFTTDPDDLDRADAGSETVILKMADQFGNHNGGALAFGPDGYLYVSTGDGGGGGDPLDSGRRLDTPLAKVLRIDVDVPAGSNAPYRVPDDNPFVGLDDALPEIWLTGLRNPWRMHFDRSTGDLWIGDVGQGAWEEVDVARGGVGGLDYGWNEMEGTHCFRTPDGECATDGLTLPVTEYSHDFGCSVVGGTVYRGTAQPSLAGWYVFADYCSGYVWVLDPTDDGPTDPQLVLESGRSISAIGEDAAGELIATDLSTGELLRITAGD
jgi:glucose/arabinose dehydrogenase